MPICSKERKQIEKMERVSGTREKIAKGPTCILSGPQKERRRVGLGEFQSNYGANFPNGKSERHKPTFSKS